MSMLAEPRRKVRYNINPNGNLWANDSGTFGKKMLERMGWSSGKGLGANLDGMTSHVKVHYKSDQGGVGFKDRNDQWTAHEDNFTELLKNLQSNGHQAIEPKAVNAEDALETISKRKSLELKSKTSKARVHYHKFTRGKDLSRYSSKDLANIFGRKSLDKNTSVSNEGSKERNAGNDYQEDRDKEKEKTYGVDTVQGGSMTDYFKKKMSQFKLTFGTSKTPQSEDDEEDARPSFDMGSSQGSMSRESPETKRVGEFGIISVAIEETEKKCKRKCSDHLQQDTPKKKARRSQDKATGVNNEAFNDESLQETDDNCNFGVLPDDNPYEIKPKVKKCKKKDRNKDKELENSICDVEEVIEESNMKKSKKKEKKCLGGLENPTFEGFAPENYQDLSSVPGDTVQDVSEALNPYEVVNMSKKEKKKDKKKKPKQNDGVENPNFDGSLVEDHHQGPLEIESNPYEIVVKEKKKKKTKALLEDGIENPTFKDNSVEIDQEQCTEGKEKKKKKKRKEEIDEENGRKNKAVQEVQDNGIENPVFSDNTTDIDQEDVPVVKEKKKKKSKAKEEVTDSQIINEEGDVMKNRRKSKTEESFTMEEINESQDFGAEDGGREEPVKKKKKKKDIEELEVIRQIQPKENDNNEIHISTPTTPRPPFSSSTSQTNNFGISDDLILNVSSTDPKPILHAPRQTRAHRRKSVRIDETLNQERIIPNIQQQKQMMLLNGDGAGLSGVDNAGFEAASVTSGGNVGRQVRNLLDAYQTEIENDINEGKRRQQVTDGGGGDAPRYVGAGAVLDEHRRLPNGNVELAFKHANLTQTVTPKKNARGARSAYGHLVRGDVEVAFVGANLHAVTGYATAEALAKAKAKAAQQSTRTPMLPKSHVTDMTQVKKLERIMNSKKTKKSFCR